MAEAPAGGGGQRRALLVGGGVIAILFVITMMYPADTPEVVEPAASGNLRSETPVAPSQQPQPAAPAAAATPDAKPAAQPAAVTTPTPTPPPVEQPAVETPPPIPTLPPPPEVKHPPLQMQRGHIKECKLTDSYVQYVCRAMAQVKMSMNTVFDIGANHGSYMERVLLDRDCLHVEINNAIAFEPYPAMHAGLQQSLIDNVAERKKHMGKGNTVAKMEIKGVGDKADTLTFYEGKARGHGGFAGGNRKGVHSGKTMQVEVVSAAEYVAAHPELLPIGYIKVDVEGFEPAVIQGMEPLLHGECEKTNTCVPTFQFEYGGAWLDERSKTKIPFHTVVGWLTSWKMDVYIIADGGRGPPILLQIDADQAKRIKKLCKYINIIAISKNFAYRTELLNHFALDSRKI